MRRPAAAFAIFALTFTAQLAAQDTERINRAFQVGTGAELRLKTFSGHVRITGSDTQQIAVDAVRHGSRSQLDAIKLEIDQHGSTVIVDANVREGGWLTWWGGRDAVDTDFDIAVPRRTRVRVHAFSAAVDVTDTAGDLEVHTFSSPVRVEHVAGTLDLHSFSGPITIRTDDSIGAIEIKTFSGRVDLRVPEKAHAIADFRSFSGRLNSALPLQLRSVSRRDTTAELDGPGPAGHIRVKTFSGDLRIDR